MRFRRLKKQVYELLKRNDFSDSLEKICKLPSRQVVNPLFSFFYHNNELIRWRAIIAMGRVVAKMVHLEKESARVVMRRLIWNLNDESGGIGWGSPEAMGEIMAQHTGMADEYHNILVSYIMPEGNYLEHEILQRGVLWGIGRLAHANPNHVKSSVHYLLPYMTSHDPYHRGLAAWTAALFDNEATNSLLRKSRKDQAVFTLYQDGQLSEVTVSSLACTASSFY